MTTLSTLNPLRRTQEGVKTSGNILNTGTNGREIGTPEGIGMTRGAGIGQGIGQC